MTILIQKWPFIIHYDVILSIFWKENSWFFQQKFMCSQRLSFRATQQYSIWNIFYWVRMLDDLNGLMWYLRNNKTVFVAIPKIIWTNMLIESAHFISHEDNRPYYHIAYDIAKMNLTICYRLTYSLYRIWIHCFAFPIWLRMASIIHWGHEVFYKNCWC